MGLTLQSLVPMLRLARVTNAAAAVGNLWFVVLWSRAMSQEQQHWTHFGLALTGATISALGLYTFGTALNDLFDQKRDRVVRADRPLARGQLSLETACSVLVASLIAGVLGATVFGLGGVIVAALIGLAVLWYNVAARYVPAFGLVLLGLIYAMHMFVANVGLSFLWPVWLVMTHSLCVAGMTYVLGRKVPRLSGRALAAAAVGWAFWTGVLAARQWQVSDTGLWPDWVPVGAIYWPLAAAAGYVLLVVRKGSQVSWGPRAAEKAARYGSLWLPIYGAAWLVGVDEYVSAMWMGGLVIVAQVCVVALREVRGLAENPAGFRR